MPELSESDRVWWGRSDPEEFDPKAHEKLQAVMTHIDRTQDYRKRAALLHGSMYGGVPVQGMGVSTIQRTSPGGNGGLSLNVSRNVVDAVVSRVASKAKPHLSYVTDGASYEKQEMARQLERGVDGLFYQTSMYDYAVCGFRDGCVFGQGTTAVIDNEIERCVDVERDLPWENFHDDAETMYGSPRSRYRRKYRDKHRMAHLYEDFKDEIARLAPEVDKDAEYGFQGVAIRIAVCEGWHLPSVKGATDGRYVCSVEGLTLVDQPWDPDIDGPWPFASYVWSPTIVGTDPKGCGSPGQGIVELGAPIQAEINKLVRQIQMGHHLITGHWLVDVNSKVVASHINNDLSTILKYAGIKPEYNSPAIISPEVYEHLWNLVQRYYTLAGVNEQTAAAQKPQGLDSGEAQRVYADQQTETLLEKGARYEAYVRELGCLSVHAAKRLAKSGSYEVRSMADDSYQTIDWRKLEDPDGFELVVQETSSLPGTIAGKLATANDLQKLGEFDAADILELTGMADLMTVEKRKLASRRLVEKKVDLMLREGEPYAPHSLLNLDEAVAIARDMCNEAEAKDVPDENLQLVRDFITAAIKLKGTQPQQAPQQAGPGGAILGPGAAPVALPQAGGPAPAPAPGPPAQAAA